MKVEIEDISSVKRKLRIEVPAELVSDEFERAYRELKRTARLRGFRPGKIPRTLLERYYGDQVRFDVTSKLIQETYGKSLEEHALTPVSQPEFEDVQVRQGEDFHYTAVVEIKPLVEVSGYQGLKVEREEPKVTEEQVDARLEEIREMLARLEDLEAPRPIQEGDFVLVQHRFHAEGDPHGQRAPQEQMLELTADRVEEKLMKALIGLQPGEEADVSHQFSTDHGDPGLAGKEGTLHVTVKAIRKKVLPDLDDALATRLGEYANLEELKAKIREELEEGEKRRVRSVVNESIVEQLLKKHDFEVPEALVEFQIEEMIRNAQRRLAVHGLTLERTGSSPEQMRASFREPAIRAVRTSLILEAIARKEGIEITDEGLREAYERIARQTGRDVKQVEEVYRDSAALEMLKGSILEEKSLDFLREQAKMVDKKS